MVTPEKAPEPGLVGRSEEILGIDRALGALRKGRGRALMLVGEPGIGKSTLARLAARRAEQERLPVFWGFAWEAGGAPGYWPWTQLLGSLVSECSPPERLVSGLAQLLPGREAPDGTATLQPNQARFRLLESVRRLLENVSHRSPIVLVLEDLHAADSDSLHLVHYVARHVAGMPVLLIGTFREAEARAMAAGEPLWRACRDAEVMRLRRLDADSIRDFLQARRAGALSETDVDRLYEITEGNPLFLTELVALLDRRELEDAPLPATIEQVIRQQAALLPDDAVARLGEASVLGRDFDLQALAAVSGESPEQTERALAAAIETGLLRGEASGTLSFSHVLYRDVLYNDLDPATRSRVHLGYARHLRRLIAAGHEDRWTELAGHLHAAGHEHRADALAAWRRAARRALERLAFDDAAESLGQALRSLDGGPACEPTDRYRLLLECAEATMLAGDTATGQRHCREAFEIARGLDDPALMAEAALAWGGVFVVARVDDNLIAALRSSLAALPDDQVALRARVLARLAGALQPAPDPNEPMDMAREAIALARTTGDPDVVYQVLRSAISALMDFALPAERIPLNEEFFALASRFGDVPGQFRSQLRLVIDACEAGERGKMDAAIEHVHRLAEKIGLPHYRWRAASVRALQATIDGDFARATRLLDAAEAYAEEFGDVEARVTLPTQRFAVLIEWEGDSGTTAEQIEARLRDGYDRGMAGAETFIGPLFVSLGGSERAARALLEDREKVEQLIAGGDRYSLCRIGEMARRTGERAMAGRALEALRPHADSCATAGLLGTVCTGPTAWCMGRFAMGLDQVPAARDWLVRALEVAQAMRAPPWIARISLDLAEACRQAGDEDAARDHERRGRKLVERLGLRRRRGIPTPLAAPDTPPAAPDTTPPAGPGHAFSLERTGELWQVSFDGHTTMLKPSRGLEMLAMLVARPDREVHVLELSGGGPGGGQGESTPALDEHARRQYEARIEALREQLEEAEELGDAGRADAAREEIDFIGRELARAFGLGGRARPVGQAAERARVNVRRRLKDAIDRVGRQHLDAGRYLENTIKTGTYCKYTPM